MIHFLIVQLGSQDLMAVALASIERFAGTCNVDIVKLPESTTDPRAHGQAIDDWRRYQQITVMDRDIVVVMDPDVVLLSEWWRKELDRAFADPHVGIWGAGNKSAWGPRVHAHMMAIRGSVFNTMERSFTPCLDLREQEWRDTGGLYCMWVQAAGWEVQPVEQGKDWQWVSAWYPTPLNQGGVQCPVPMGPKLVCPECRAPWHEECGACAAEWDHPCRLQPMWAHLGGGSHSDTQRMTWRQRYLSAWRHQEIRKRKLFLRAAHTHLSSRS